MPPPQPWFSIHLASVNIPEPQRTYVSLGVLLGFAALFWAIEAARKTRILAVERRARGPLPGALPLPQDAQLIKKFNRTRSRALWFGGLPVRMFAFSLALFPVFAWLGTSMTIAGVWGAVVFSGIVYQAVVFVCPKCRKPPCKWSDARVPLYDFLVTRCHKCGFELPFASDKWWIVP